MKEQLEQVKPATASRSPDTDIDDIMVEAIKNAVRKTDEYLLGRLETLEQIQKSRIMEARDIMIPVAESFLAFLRTEKQEITVKGIRIGYDYGCVLPVALFLVDGRTEENVEAIENVARHIERYFWEHQRIQGMIWIIDNESAERGSIERDFPIFKKA